ncbi:hypothetical protein DFJ63DRAFT_208147 [Scheffersomyces coipomensis]|uniref:uncharacterized protein n=1 Tax=Scheffersomyces coipomensis TaxID=1788519 RepID=UPI00315D4AE6
MASFVRYLSSTLVVRSSKINNSQLKQISIAKSKVRKNILPLEEFVFRSRVKQIYRDVLRLIYKSHEKRDLLEFTKAEFNINANETDLNHRKYLLHLGIRRINEMVTMLGIKTPEFK